MTKQVVLLGMVLALVAGLLVACGTPKEQYDAVVSDFGKTRQELQSVKAELESAQSEAKATQAKVEVELKTAQTKVETAQADLALSNKAASSLQTDLQKSKDDIQAQQKINVALSAELAKVKYPRHFQTLGELTDWLRADDTDTNAKYASETVTNRAFILQVRAVMDGYLLPAILYDRDTVNYVGNRRLSGMPRSISTQLMTVFFGTVVRHLCPPVPYCHPSC